MRCALTGSRGPIEFQGRDELLALGRRLVLGQFDVAIGDLALPLRCRHTLTNVTLFSTEARNLWGYALLTVMTVGGKAPPRWLASGRHSDRLRKCAAGCWRFESRTFTLEGPNVPAEFDAPHFRSSTPS
jgi:hypothetical protein